MRKPRLLLEGARYHVSARANRQEMILEPALVKEMFLETLVRAKSKFDFQVEHFCIMGNHFHLLIVPGKGCSLSRVMQWIMSVFAMAWNRLRGLTGHVWGERFFSRVIASASVFAQVFQYISLNPVQAGLVRSPEEWPYSALWHFAKGWRHIVGDPPDLMTSAGT